MLKIKPSNYDILTSLVKIIDNKFQVSNSRFQIIINSQFPNNKHTCDQLEFVN